MRREHRIKKQIMMCRIFQEYIFISIRPIHGEAPGGVMKSIKFAIVHVLNDEITTFGPDGRDSLATFYLGLGRLTKKRHQPKQDEEQSSGALLVSGTVVVGCSSAACDRSSTESFVQPCSGKQHGRPGSGQKWPTRSVFRLQN